MPQADKTIFPRIRSRCDWLEKDGMPLRLVSEYKPLEVNILAISTLEANVLPKRNEQTPKFLNYVQKDLLETRNRS